MQSLSSLVTVYHPQASQVHLKYGFVGGTGMVQLRFQCGSWFSQRTVVFSSTVPISIAPKIAQPICSGPRMK